MATIGTVNVKITGDITGLVAQLNAAGLKVQGFDRQVKAIGGNAAAVTTQARGFSNLARAFTNAAGQSGVLNSEISILASSVGNVGLAAAGAGIGIGVLVGGLAASISSAVSFETAITRVAKTANLSAAETKAFGDEILSMSRRLPVATADLTKIAEVAGQLGIQGTPNITHFVEEVAKLNSTTGVASDVLATSLGTLVQVSGLPITAVDNISASITNLGNTSNSTEQQILDFSTRLVGVTTALGVPIADLLSISSSFAAAGVESERGAGAIQKIFIAIDEAAQKGGDELLLFSRVAGLTVDEFTKLQRSDPGIAFTKVVEGLKGVGNVIPILEALGISDTRLVSAALSAANAQGGLTTPLLENRVAAEQATATNTEFGRSAETTAAKFQILKNNIGATATEIGTLFLPAVNAGLDGVNGFAAGLDQDFSNFKTNITDISEKIKEAATSQGELNKHIDDLNVGAVYELGNAFLFVVSNIKTAVETIPGIGFAIQALDGVVGGAKFLFGGGGGGDSNTGGPSDKEKAQRAARASNLSLDLAELGLFGEGNGVFVPPKKGDIPIPPGLGPKEPKGPHQLTALEAAMDGVITRSEALTLGLTDQEVILLESAVAANKVADAEYRNRIGLEALAQAYPGLTGEQVKFQVGLQAIAEHLALTGESIQKFIADTSAAALSGFQSAFDAIFSKPTKEDAALKLQLDQAKRAKLLAPGASDAQNKQFDANIKRIQDLIDVRSNARDIQKDQATIADATLLSDADQLKQAGLTITAIGTESVRTAQAIGNVFLETYAKLTGGEVQTVGGGAGGGAVSDKAAEWALAWKELHDAGVPGYAAGTDYVPHNMIARLHRGEQVVPAGQRGESGAPINVTSYITVEGDATDRTVDMIRKAVREESEAALRRASFRGSYVTSGAYTPS